MTREEAKDKTEHKYNNTIDLIYDGFDSQNLDDVKTLRTALKNQTTIAEARKKVIDNRDIIISYLEGKK